ncbi:MAG: DivIVA domain-containing protein [Raoultibacter sp.]
MAITSADIQNQSFSIDRKGYNVDEVDVFLERVAGEIDALNNQIAQLHNQIDELSYGSQDSMIMLNETPSVPEVADTGEKDARIAELEQQLEERRGEDNAIAKALITAQRSGDEVVAKAKTDAENMRQEAEDEAKRILDKANNEKQRILDTIEHLQEERENARDDYQDMLKEFITSATKKLSEVGGDSLLASAPSPSAHAAQQTGRVMPKAQAPIHREVSSNVATYTTPPVNNVVVTPVTPRPSKPEKDLSGFGDADDGFEFEDVE